MASRVLTLSLKLRRRSDLLKRWYSNGRQGGIALDGALPGTLGQRCRLVITLLEPVARTFSLEGQLAWARHKGSHMLKESYGVDILERDAAGRERLLSYARQEVPESATRFEQRLSTRMQVKLVHNGDARRESLIDLSQGGAFVRTQLPLPVGSTVECDLRPPLSLRRLRLKCRVAWVREGGPNAGMGLEFHYENAKQTARVRKLLDKVATQPEEPDEQEPS